MLKKILYIALVGGVIGGGYGYYLWNKQPTKMGDRKTDMTLYATDLVSHYSDASHLGKVLEVKGSVSMVETEKDITNITFETTDQMTTVSCEMEKGFEKTSVKTGDAVTVKGQCDGKLSDVVLTRCIIVK